MAQQCSLTGCETITDLVLLETLRRRTAIPNLVNGRCASLMLSCVLKMVNAALIGSTREPFGGADDGLVGKAQGVGAPAENRASRRLRAQRSFPTRPTASSLRAEIGWFGSEPKLSRGSRLQDRDRASFGSPPWRLARRPAAAIRSSPRAFAPRRWAISPASEATEPWRMNSARSANSRLSSVAARRRRPGEAAVGRVSSACMVGVRRPPDLRARRILPRSNSLPA
jgi:hypothetical protein